MKVRVLRNPYYPGRFTVGLIYPAELAEDGRNYMVQSNNGHWLIMLPREIRFICSGVSVCETSSGASGAK